MFGALLVASWYSKVPTFTVPEGKIRFCTLMALTTSLGESPRACKRLKVEIYLYLPLLAAVGIGAFSTLDGGELSADEIQAVVVELLFGKALTRKTKLQNRHTRCRVSDD